MCKSISNIVEKISLRRVSALIPPILPWFNNASGSILDFGCGLGHMGDIISKNTGRPMTFLDVRKYPFSCQNCKIEVFDGVKIPYQDNYFDTALVAFVLHHVPDPEYSLREVLRVTRSEIIVCEDHLMERSEIFSEAIKDTIANFCLPHMTMKYRTEAEWEILFEELGLIIRDKECYSSRYIFRFNHIAWRLTKKI
jgi:ubiquinone/menaquinone biosynthesis C-methylase UbiE